MALLRYHPEELIKLRDSPSVRKPDGLPDIQQWMEVPAEQATAQRRKVQSGRADDQTINQENPVQRPLLTTRHSTRLALGDDIVLGPPKTSFSSTSRNHRPSEGGDKERSTNTGADTPLPDKSNLRDRTSRDRDVESRLPDKNNVLGTTRRRRDDEGWTNVRAGRRASTQDDGGDRWPRADREKDALNRDADPSDAPLRRNGIGRGRFDQSWREDTPEAESNRPQGRAGGWRDRERDRDRDRDREWRGRRYDTHADGDPEWMNEDYKDEPKKTRTQEDFQRWKEEMKKGGKVTSSQAPAEEKAEPQSPSAHGPKESTSAPVILTPLDIESGFGKPSWENNKPETSKVEISKPVQQKPKASRFVNLFAKEDTPIVEPEPPQVLPPNGTTAEDKQGFDRILQMLGAAKAPKSAEPPSLPLEPRQNLEVERKQIKTPTGEEGVNFITDLLARQGIPRDATSVPPPRVGPAVAKDQPPVSRFFPSTAAEGHPLSPESALPRNGPFPPPGFSGPLVQPPQPAQDADNRMFLLDLMRQAPQVGPERHHELEMMMERERLQQILEAQAATKDEQRQRVPPPGLFDMASQQRREFEQSFKQPLPAQQAQARPSIPPGFNVEEGGMMGLQRRNTTESAPRAQMSNMGIPSQQVLPPEYMRDPGMLPSMNAQNRPNIPPPPGLNAAGMRPPPGFLGHPQMPMLMGNNTLGQPGMQGNGGLNMGRGGPSPMFTGGPPGQMGGPPNMPPPGFFGAPPGPPAMPNGPPGFGPRDPRELRDFQMMMQTQGGMPGPPGPGIPNGPPGPGPFNGFMPAPGGDLNRGRGGPGPAY